MNESMSTIETVVTDQQGKGLSWRGLIEVFYKPVDFFTELKANPKILVPYLFFGLLMACFMFVVADYIVELQMNSPQFQEQMDAQGVSVTPQMISMMKISTIIFGSLAWLLYPLLVSGIALLMGNFIFGGRAKYSQLLSVMLYSSIVFMAGYYLVLPLIFAKGSLLVSLSPAVFVPDPKPTDLLYLTLSKFGVFGIWEVIAAGIGLSVVYDFSRNKGYTIAVISIGMLSLLQILTTVFSA